jgi:hypothetical protein
LSAVARSCGHWPPPSPGPRPRARRWWWWAATPGGGDSETRPLAEVPRGLAALLPGCPPIPSRLRLRRPGSIGQTT